MSSDGNSRGYSSLRLGHLTNPKSQLHPRDTLGSITLEFLLYSSRPYSPEAFSPAGIQLESPKDVQNKSNKLNNLNQGLFLETKCCQTHHTFPPNHRRTRIHGAGKLLRQGHLGTGRALHLPFKLESSNVFLKVSNTIKMT